jgi:hypothetical protein
MRLMLNKNNIFRIKLMRVTLIVFLSIAIALSAYNVFIIYPSFTKLVIETTKDDAVLRIKPNSKRIFLRPTPWSKSKKS